MTARTMAEFERLAEEAKPIQDFPSDHERNGRDDWGSERQTDAENAFFDAVRDAIPAELFAGLESYCLKATTGEMLAEGLRIVRLHLSGRVVVPRIGSPDMTGAWRVVRARTLLHISCGGVGVCSISVSANHVHEDYPGCKKEYVARQEAFAAFIVEACNAHNKR